MSNGCKFTRNGVVSIDADTFKRGKRAWIRFKVSDTGRGMNKEEQKKLFTPFLHNQETECLRHWSGVGDLRRPLQVDGGASLSGAQRAW